MFVESVIVIIIQHVDHVNCNVNRIYLPNGLGDLQNHIKNTEYKIEITSLNIRNKYLKI